jgi:hypothetical protein
MIDGLFNLKAFQLELDSQLHPPLLPGAVFKVCNLLLEIVTHAHSKIF